jgi:hypothetical protein
MLDWPRAQVKPSDFRCQISGCCRATLITWSMSSIRDVTTATRWDSLRVPRISGNKRMRLAREGSSEVHSQFDDPARQGVKHLNHADRNRYPLARRNHSHELDDVWRLLGDPENAVTLVSVVFLRVQSAKPLPVCPAPRPRALVSPTVTVMRSNS